MEAHSEKTLKRQKKRKIEQKKGEAMECKTKSGIKVKFKDISIDEKDMLLDSIEYEFREDGSAGNIKMLNTTMTKWFRTCIKGDSSDKFLKTFSIQDRTEIFLAMQDYVVLGEKRASN